MGRHRLIAVSALPLMLIVAACSGGATPSPAAPSQAAPGAAASPSEAASASEAESPAASAETSETYEVKVASASIGTFLTGEDGKTLYTFKDDTAGKSTCSGTCAANWPAFTVDSKDQLKAGAGVTGALDVISRADGSMQVTYKGAPLYYFSGDTKAGDTNGQGLFGKWFVANP